MLQSKFQLVSAVSLVTAALAVLLAFGSTGLPGGASIAHARLSCDNPPAPLDDPDLLSRVQSVWDKTDFCRHSVGFNEIISGGVPRDGIPPIDNPSFESVEAGFAWLQEQSPVIAVEHKGSARAYPLAIMTRHEIVNDVIGGDPVAVTFCPLCNSAIAFDRTVNGRALRFGVSGLLRNSDLVMWDDFTQSWWQQFTGEAIVGRYTGTRLKVLSSQVVGFGQFVEQHPNGEVLSRDTGFLGNYGSNSYIGYDSDEDPFLFLGEPDERMFPTERVLAGIIGGDAIAYPFPILNEERVINDTISGRNVVAFYEPGQASALDAADINASRDVGSATLFSRQLDGRVLTFNFGDDGAIRDDQTSSVWNIFGQSVGGQLAGRQLQQLNAAPHFWFAWAAFRPDTLVYQMG